MIQKQNINIPFSQGLDLKTDPYQVQIGKFLSLENSIFDEGGRLTKRNGYKELTGVPNVAPYLTTLNDNLTTIGSTVNAYNADTQNWVTKGTFDPIELSTLPLIKNSINQIQCDAVVAGNGLVCTVYSEMNNGTVDYKYVIADSLTGQNIVPPTLIPASGGGTITGSPRVFLLGTYFILVFTNVITATSHLQYITISSNLPSSPHSPADITTSYVSATTLSWDGLVVNNQLYIAYNTTTGGQAIKATYLTIPAAIAGNSPVTPLSFNGQKASMMSLCADTSGNFIQIYLSWWDATSTNGFTASFDLFLNLIFNPQQIITTTATLNLASAAQGGSCLVFSEVDNNYSYDSGIPSHFINGITVSSSGVVGSPYTVVRSVGLASKAFIINSNIYFLSAFQSPFQPTYFLINGSTSVEAAPQVVAKLAYENGGGYLTLGLPNIAITDNKVSIPYLFKDFISSLSRQGNSQQTTTGGIYSQTGINLVSFTIGTTNIDSAEIASALHIGGGFLWEYDGYLPVEHNFFLWPDSVEVSGSATMGSMTAQQYYYQVIYTWPDNQGNIHRSAPSIPVPVTLTSDTSVLVNIPYLRLTYKIANPLKIEIYRWSTANQVYYQVTSLTAPTLNSTTSDSLAYTDTLADSDIIGNAIIYTEGGVLENVNAPSTSIMTLYDARLWLVDAEDPNLLWYSKQVIEAVPVEMSDLLTFYVAPSTGVQGSTGPITALAPMDDKIIIFKASAIYYINGAGQGPDNTGANNGYSQPIFITSVVGCANQQSIVFMPQGLMFQSGKGIWLLNRSLQASYIGAPVESLTKSGAIVQSAVSIPQSNQIRFTLNTGITLMYDYYYEQWGTFSGVPALSSCIYQSLHTFLNSRGLVFQENPNSYLDGTEPVLMQFTTSWINLAALQGFERAYYFYMLATYLSPHFLQFNISYNYISSSYQSSLIYPRNFSDSLPSPYGDQPAPFGSHPNIEQWRIFLKQQKCQSVQISMQENFDATFGTVAGAGLTISGLSFLMAIKRGVRPIAARQSVG